jgi:uncharacterized metal-binding protein YceD (DUF177 family)
MTWTHILRLGEIPRDGVTLSLSPSEEDRKVIARALDLLTLDRLDARVRVTPWLDGVQLDGSWTADVAQACGVTLERLESALSGDFLVRAVPAGSPHAASEEEVEVSLDADDPPDVLEQDFIDLAAYVIEHLALEIDPFPRKPGAEFVQPPEIVDLSPFAALKKLRPEGE